MEAALAALAAHAVDAIRKGYNILIRPTGRSDRIPPIPALLATAAVHQHLVKKGLRTRRGPGGRDRLRRARCTTSRCSPVTARRRSTLPRARDAGPADPAPGAPATGRPKGRAEQLRQGDRQGL